jgi:acyl carrier protein
MLRSTIKEKMIKFIKDYFIKKSETVLDDDILLVENGIIDSTGVIELVCFIEETFEIRVEDEEIISENLDSINRLVDFIQPKVAKSK